MTEVLSKVVDGESVSVIGTGDFGRALSVCLVRGNYEVHIGSQVPSARKPFLESVCSELAGVSVLGIGEAIEKSDVIFLAINSEHYESMKIYSEILKGKILVDVCNPWKLSETSVAEELQSMFPQSKVCKAFNTTSADALTESSAVGASQIVYVSADELEVRARVTRIAVGMGLQVMELGGLKTARRLERSQQTLCSGWGWATIVTGIWFVLWTIYITCQKFIMDDAYSTPTQWPLSVFNQICAVMAINQLALCYLPGCFASFIQLCKGTKYSAFPRWLDLWLKMRKQLGLYGLVFVGMHTCLSLILFGPVYFPLYYKFDGKVVSGKVVEGSEGMMKASFEATFHIAIWATVFYIVLGISSLPSVVAMLNWREWRLVQSYMGHFCLVLAVSHVVVLKWFFFKKRRTFVALIDEPETLCLLIPGLVLLCRVFLWLPCVNSYVWKIRRGHVRGQGNSKCGDIEKATGK